LVRGQRSMLESTLPEEVRAFAQRFAAQIIVNRYPKRGRHEVRRALLSDARLGRLRRTRTGDGGVACGAPDSAV
jgi:hypothetical protein